MPAAPESTSQRHPICVTTRAPGQADLQPRSDPPLCLATPVCSSVHYHAPSPTPQRRPWPRSPPAKQGDASTATGRSRATARHAPSAPAATQAAARPMRPSAGTLDLLVLNAIAVDPLHCYAIARQPEQTSRRKNCLGVPPRAARSRPARRIPPLSHLAPAIAPGFGSKRCAPTRLPTRELFTGVNTLQFGWRLRSNTLRKRPLSHPLPGQPLTTIRRKLVPKARISREVSARD